MVVLSLVLLLLVAVVPVLRLVLRRVGDPTVVLAAVAGLLLAGAAAVAAFADPADGFRRGAALTLGVVAATTAGSDVVRATFRVMRGELDPRRRTAVPPAPPAPQGVAAPDDDLAAGSVLRGGAWIGYLERAAVSATLLAGWPEGIALILAVKGVGRYPELRGSSGTDTHASEAFIIGTLASVLWAVAAAGTAWLVVT